MFKKLECWDNDYPSIWDLIWKQISTNNGAKSVAPALQVNAAIKTIYFSTLLLKGVRFQPLYSS